MRLVRIDRLAPGGAALELHPRLTLVAGAPPETRRRLQQITRALVGEDEPEFGGLVEISGVHLALDRPTLDQLRLDPSIDPVLDLSTPAAPVPPEPPRVGADPFAPPGPVVTEPPERWVTSTVVANRDSSDLRLELRGVNSERTRLGERMEAARQGLDSFSRASLEVVRGQIDALERRRAAIRRNWETERSAREERERELLEEIAQVRASLTALGSLEVAPVEAARAELDGLLRAPTEPDPAAVALADRLESLTAEVHRNSERQRSYELQMEDASRALASARDELARVEWATRAPSYDPAVVRRLEQVRDEIFSSDDRAGLLGSARNKRRIQELRDEEAVLLEQLGFDTYSSYVMGIPSVRAEMERSERVTAAQERVEQAEQHLGEVRASAPTSADALDQLQMLVARARDLVRPTAPAFPGDAASPEGLATEATALAAALRQSRQPLPPDHPQVREAVEALEAAMGSPVWSGRSPTEVIAAADEWLATARARAEQAAASAARLEQLERQLEESTSSPEPELDVDEWAKVEGELDAALDRLAEAEERVRSHEEAMDRLADLRTEELRLRERERELLAAIAEAEGAGSTGPAAAFGAATAAGGAPGSPGGQPVDPWTTPPPYRGPLSTAATAARAPQPPFPAPDLEVGRSGETGLADLEWTLVARLAEQRAVSFAGSVPLLVEGLPAEPAPRAAILDRLAAMSELVQIILLSDDRDATDRVAALGTDAAVVQL